MPILNLTNGAKCLAFSMLSLPELFKTPVEKFRAGLLQDVLETKPPHEKALQKVDPKAVLTDAVEAMQDAQEAFFLADVEVTITDGQRDLLRTICTDHAKQLPTGSKHTNRLLLELGLCDKDGNPPP